MAGRQFVQNNGRKNGCKISTTVYPTERNTKTIRTDKASAFTGRFFREFCKKNYISIIYGTPYIHTPNGLVERGVRTLKENLLTNIKAGEPFGKALDLALYVMRTTPHTRLKKSAFELHFVREPNTELSNMLNVNEIKKLTNNHSFLAKPETCKSTHSVEKAVAQTICQ